MKEILNEDFKREHEVPKMPFFLTQWYIMWIFEYCQKLSSGDKSKKYNKTMPETK